MQVLKSLQDSVKQIEQMYADYEDLGLLIEMSQEEQDEDGAGDRGRTAPF